MKTLTLLILFASLAIVLSQKNYECVIKGLHKGQPAMIDLNPLKLSTGNYRTRDKYSRFFYYTMNICTISAPCSIYKYAIVQHLNRYPDECLGLGRQAEVKAVDEKDLSKGVIMNVWDGEDDTSAQVLLQCGKPIYGGPYHQGTVNNKFYFTWNASEVCPQPLKN